MTTYRKPNVKNRIIAGTVAAAVGVPLLWYGLSSVDSPSNPAVPVKTTTGTHSTYSPSEEDSSSTEETTSSTKKPATRKPTTKATVKPKPTHTEVYYESCIDVWNSGDGDGIRKGEPGYRRGLDRDGDGTACENQG
jgi:hypothetical protein